MPSRVQPIPPAQNGSKPSGGKGSARGITIQDLKKQTALRLAHEQGHQVLDPKSQYSTYGHPHPGADQSYRYNQHQSQPHSYQPYHQPNYYRPDHAHQQQHSTRHHQPNNCSPYPYSNPTPHSYHQPTGYENQQLNYHAPPQYVHQQQSKPGGSGDSFGDKPRSPGRQQPHKDRTRHHSKSDHRSVASGRSQGGDSSTGGRKKTKLPHGLTVQELKEMTRARLQEEAAERMSSEGSTQDAKRFSPLDFETASTDAMERPLSRNSVGYRDRTMSRDSNHGGGGGAAFGTHLHGLSDSMSSIPSMVQVLPNGNRETSSFVGRQPQVSPLPPGFQSMPPGIDSTSKDLSSHGVTRQDSWQPQSRSDTWDGASTSTVASEFLGSESAYEYSTTGMSQGFDDLGSLQFNRTRSYTGNSTLNGPSPDLYNQDSSIGSSVNPPPGMQLFDAAVGAPNRRRAVTMSPRPGRIHENRPHFQSEDNLQFPNFNSEPAMGMPSLRSRAANNYSPSFGQRPSNGLFVGEVNSNRPRTSSAVSLPTISHTADEFATENPIGSRFASNTSLFESNPIREEGNISLTDGLFGYAGVPDSQDAPVNIAASSSVFRDVRSSEGNAHAHEPRLFGLSNPDSTLSSFGIPESGFTNSPTADDLAQDLGSILKLSGVTGDRTDQENL